jgi:signal transduction histidine kinase
MSQDDTRASEPKAPDQACLAATAQPGERGCAARSVAAGRLELLRLRGASPEAELTPIDVQSVLDAIPYYVMLIDADHNILLVNQAVGDALDVEPCSIIGGYCPQVVHQSAEPYARCPLEQARELGEAVECDDVDPATGRVLLSGVYPTPYETSAGVAVYLHTVQDITEKRAAEEHLKRNLEAQALVNDLLHLALQPIEFDDLLQRVVDRIVALPWLAAEPKGTIFLTDETRQTLVLRAHHGLPQAQLEVCARLPFGRCHCGRAAETREIQHTSCVDDDHEHCFNGMVDHGHYCVPITDGDIVLGVLGTTIDPGHERNADELQFLSTVADVLAGIIQRKRAEALQREHQRVALSRERMARVGEVSAGVAHTIRNPLHGVLNCVEIVETQTQRGETPSPEVLSMMRDGLVRIERVTRRLLALTRESEITPTPTDVGDLLGDVLDLTMVQAKKKLVEVILDARFTGQASLNGDRIIEGLSSVISNAIDACEEGDTVTVRAKIEGRPRPALIIEVEDTGSGIPDAVLPRVLDPFFTTKPIGEGSGLGLAITRRVMDEHEGEVRIDSREGEGTLVRLVFPKGAIDDPSVSNAGR